MPFSKYDGNNPLRHDISLSIEHSIYMNSKFLACFGTFDYFLGRNWAHCLVNKDFPKTLHSVGAVKNKHITSSANAPKTMKSKEYVVLEIKPAEFKMSILSDLVGPWDVFFLPEVIA